MDKHIESLREKLKTRSEVGLKKYGVGLDRNGLSSLEWLNHLQEELLDAAGHVERLMSDMQWIEVNDRLPPFDKSVFVHCGIYGRYIAYRQRIGDTNDGVWCNWSGECGILPPTHWMPLPEPPIGQ